MITLEISIFSLLIFTFSLIIPANAQKQTEDRPLKIIHKPAVSRDVISKCLNPNNKNTYILVKLRVTFHSSGKITEVEIVEASGCDYFNEEAIRSARKTKFKPAIKNGEAVTIVKSMEYQAGIR